LGVKISIDEFQGDTNIQSITLNNWGQGRVGNQASPGISVIGICGPFL
jgi:hypothetical protein